MSRLSERLNEAKPNISVQAAVERARKAGHAIDRGTVYRYLKGNHAKDPSDETLAALAEVFELKVTELRKLAEKPIGELEPYQPPAYANRLNREQRKALNELIRTIVGSIDVTLVGDGNVVAAMQLKKTPGLSEPSDRTDDLRAAHEEEGSISAEQEGDETP